MTIAIDRDYEQMTCEPQWRREYWWPDRCWRWVLEGRVEFGRRPQLAYDEPAGPEPRFITKAKREPREGTVTRRAHAWLVEHGPATATQMAKALGVSDSSIVHRAIKDRPSLFEKCEKARVAGGDLAYLWRAL